MKLERALPVEKACDTVLTHGLVRDGLSCDAEMWWAGEDPTGRLRGETLASSAVQALFLVRLTADVGRSRFLPSEEGLYLALIHANELELSIWWPVGDTLDTLLRRVGKALARGGYHPSLVLAIGTWVLGGLAARAEKRVEPLPVEDAVEGLTWIVCDPGSLVSTREVAH